MALVAGGWADTFLISQKLAIFDIKGRGDVGNDGEAGHSVRDDRSQSVRMPSDFRKD
jgi:hypothetical protein